MTNIGQFEVKKPPPLDTLAQLIHFRSKPNLNLLKRARSKWWTNQLAFALKYSVDESDILYKMYSHSINCCTILSQNGSKITSRFCNTRLCNVCNRIRTAKMMNGYVSQMAKFKNIEFITLTIPNCKAEELEEKIEEMYNVFVKIKRILKLKGIELNGLRKLETTYNARTDTYHPHYHMLMEGNFGKQFVYEWLKRFPKANIKGQDYRDADQDCLNEIFKYTTKILTKSSKGGFDVYVHAINTIMRSMYGKRSIQTFGSIRKVTEDVDDVKSQEYENIPEYEFMEWIWRDCDWVNGLKPNSIETLTGYVPPEKEINFVE
jgi:Replication protein